MHKDTSKKIAQAAEEAGINLKFHAENLPLKKMSVSIFPNNTFNSDMRRSDVYFDAPYFCFPTPSR
jgi:hypothetical protein